MISINFNSLFFAVSEPDRAMLCVVTDHCDIHLCFPYCPCLPISLWGKFIQYILKQ